MRRFVAAVVVLAMVGLGCSDESTGDRTTPATSITGASTTTAPDADDGLVVYALAETADFEGPYLVPVSREAVDGWSVTQAVDMLMLGLSFTETGHGLWTEVPPGLRPHSVTFDDGGVATIDMPAEFAAGGGTAAMLGRLGQLVATVLDSPGIDGVRLAIDGRILEVFSGEGIVLDDPMTMESIRGLIPPVAVASPSWGQTVPVPFEVTGEATGVAIVGWALLDLERRIVSEGHATVRDSAFRFDIAPPAGALEPSDIPYEYTLVVWDAENGAQRHTMERVLTLLVPGSGATR